jgi:hypothetical protein
MNGYRVTLLDIDKIGPTEETDLGHVNSLVNAIQISGVWTHPLLVDDVVCALMDGHHRYRAAQRIGLRTVPVALLSYDDHRVRLEAWRPGETYTPERLREIAGTGALLPQKSTRHVIDMPLPYCCVPLDALMSATSSACARPEGWSHLPLVEHLGAELGSVAARVRLKVLEGEPRCREGVNNPPKPETDPRLSLERRFLYAAEVWHYYSEFRSQRVA